MALMSGIIALVGAGEFLEGMAEVDSYLLAQVPEQPARVAILPTAAGLEDPRAWTDMGVPHFQRLGAQAEPVFVRDQKDANDPAMAEAVRKSNFVYLSGGSPGYLLQSLQGSEVWAAIQEVYAKGRCAGWLQRRRHGLGRPDARGAGWRSLRASVRPKTGGWPQASVWCPRWWFRPTSTA